MFRGSVRARHSCQEPQEERRKMFEIYLRVDVQRPLKGHANRLQLLLRRKLNLVAVRTGLQWLQGAEIIHVICQCGIESFFEVHPLRGDRGPRDRVNATNGLPGKEDMSEFVSEKNQ